MTYLVDADLVIDPPVQHGRRADYLDSIGEWTYSIVTAMELIIGAANQSEVKNLDSSRDFVGPTDL